MTLQRAVAAEFIGTALLLAAVVGSGIMGERLSGGNVAIALLANAIATGAVLVALIASFMAVSGAHFNPLVTLAEVALRRCTGRKAMLYLLAQLAGAVAGVLVAHAMFDLPWLAASAHVRSGPHQWWSEVVASFGLLTVILNVAKHRPEAVPAAVGSYIAGAYWFTASTSFANPAVTLARSLTNTFAGIRPTDAPGFILSQLAGAALAFALFTWMERAPPCPTNASSHD
ncbi:aquaporin Z [Variovorax sp. SRS16]|uniref:aquaporin n=1 Tax=Variovorax sp. SRS16 TaxID=282217 RepID=UPI0013164C8F|nr:MIP/aquaporin family protein [Variovorax sp. SRS16]VTU16358.1 aquaporin Z [Variovorax sp. SRS16]